jgi:hypothetical protein
MRNIDCETPRENAFEVLQDLGGFVVNTILPIRLIKKKAPRVDLAQGALVDC